MLFLAAQHIREERLVVLISQPLGHPYENTLIRRVYEGFYGLKKKKDLRLVNHYGGSSKAMSVRPGSQTFWVLFLS